MRIARLLSAALVSLAAAACAQEPAPLPPAAPAVAAPAEAPAPIIFCEQPTFDFGAAESGQIITHEFVLTNRGTAQLDIGSVRPSCGCTVANISTQAVPPGGVARVTAQLNLAGRSGPQHKAITVDSNDPKQPQLTLMLSGNVADSILITPGQLIFGQLSHTSSTVAEVILSSGNGQTFNITGVALAMPVFTTEVTPREAGKSYSITVRTKPPMTPGNYQSVMRISTDSPSKPAVDVLVAANVVGDLVVAPTEITLAEQPGQKATRFIVLRTSSGQPFAQPEVIAPDPGIGVQIFPFGINGYRVQLTNLPTEKAFDGKVITIRTAIESMKEITVPIRVLNTTG
jgi:hypothetical protein